jgi:hypothetical protein
MDSDPLKFKGEFSFHYIEDDNARVPPCYEGITTYIPLIPSIETDVDGTTVLLLSGRQSPFKPKCMDLRLNHHNYGMWFAVNCLHHDERFKDKVLWRRAVEKTFAQQLTAHETSLTLLGDAPEVANSHVSVCTLNVVKQKHCGLHIVSVELRMKLDTYDQFIRRYFR